MNTTTTSTVPAHRSSTTSAADPVDAIVVKAHHALAQVIPTGMPCALLDHPDHPNVGDSAIWMGERVFLRANRNRVAYSCSVLTFNEDTLRRAMPEGIVLIHGGGNFGTLWPHHQKLRERILERLTDYRIVQLPQTIRFEDAASAAHTAQLISAHKDFHVLTRDTSSLAFAREQLGAKSSMCPDAALLLVGKLKREAPIVDCLVLARTDKERAFADLEHAFAHSQRSVQTADWLEEPTGLLHRVRNRLKYATRHSFASSPLFQAAMLAVWDRLATERTQRGCRLLSRGRIVITDRLHAHILSTLLGIPHIVLDNNYGKLSGFIDTWTRDNPLVHRASSTREATQIAERLLQARG
ncbi:MAG TPA: polysaccharide pyruvyl transferase family protein [Steroidobacteraceae bacterium]|nr:polysaccharide pyruvyl transferase family protein [Steroidobacteraceae bacterium]